METPLTPEYAFRIRGDCFANFEARTGFEPETLRQKILSLLLFDWEYWPMSNMVMVLNEATSISQRIGEMKREGLQFEQKHKGHNNWFWKLVTGLDEIDLKNCRLKVGRTASFYNPQSAGMAAIPNLSGPVSSPPGAAVNPPEDGFRQADSKPISSAAPTKLQLELM